MRERHPENAPGDWFIDRDCIDCGASRAVAPDLIGERGGQCVFVRQPESAEDELLAWRARLLCPTASVRSERPLHPPDGVFPEAMTEDVWRLGFNARSSWGAHSFLFRHAGGNAMVDAPRWSSHVADAIAAKGGLAQILLTHRDDVADAKRYAEHFSARIFIHEDDRAAAPYATDIVQGRDAQRVAPGVVVIPLPGHTKGSVAYLLDDRCLFTGDSLAWDFATADLRASRAVCWWSWPEQLASLARLLGHRFEWVFAGHGDSHGLPTAEMHDCLRALLRRHGSPA